MKKLLLVVTLFGVVSCHISNPNNELGTTANSSFYTRVEGCNIYKVSTVGALLYLSKCDDVTNSAVQFKVGKATSSNMVQAATPQLDDQKILEKAEQIKARQEIMKKLTPEEQKVLGFN
ncbi:MAG: hypothetical protein ACXW2E_01790 [Nitrososphaeraceae archaeon]